MIDPAMVGVTTMSLSQAIGAFTTFLPPIADIRKNDPTNDPEFTADVRMGEVAAVTITIGVGVIISGLTGSSAPALVALLAAVGLVVLYESALRRERPLESK